MLAHPVPRRVVPLLLDVGTVAGHTITLLSLEVWDGWTDLRFARIDVAASRPLPRRVPPPEAWEVAGRSGPYTVEDAVGRGDRSFSNGEVRLRPAVPDDGEQLTVQVTVLDGEPPVAITVPVPALAGDR